MLQQRLLQSAQMLTHHSYHHRRLKPRSLLMPDRMRPISRLRLVRSAAVPAAIACLENCCAKGWHVHSRSVGRRDGGATPGTLPSTAGGFHLGGATANLPTQQAQRPRRHVLNRQAVLLHQRLIGS
jgi:hypothetical protein